MCPPPVRPARVARLVRASVAGIRLTDAERTALAGVRARYGAQLRVIRAEARPMSVRLRAARLAHDSVAARAAINDLRTERQKGGKTVRAALADVRAAIGVDHRARFDQNMLVIRTMLRPVPRPRATGVEAKPAGR